MNAEVKAQMLTFIRAHETHGEYLPCDYSRSGGELRLTIDCPCGASHVSTYSGDVQVILANGWSVPISTAPQLAVIHGLTAS